jgi:hypothetical protein
MMETIEIAIPTSPDPAALIARIERAAAAEGLDAGDRMTLRTFPGSIHWHLRHPGAQGVLELTYWPDRGRLWFAVHANRRADWIAPAIERLRARLQQSPI